MATIQRGVRVTVTCPCGVVFHPRKKFARMICALRLGMLLRNPYYSDQAS